MPRSTSAAMSRLLLLAVLLPLCTARNVFRPLPRPASVPLAMEAVQPTAPAVAAEDVVVATGLAEVHAENLHERQVEVAPAVPVSSVVVASSAVPASSAVLATSIALANPAVHASSTVLANAVVPTSSAVQNPTQQQQQAPAANPVPPAAPAAPANPIVPVNPNPGAQPTAAAPAPNAGVGGISVTVQWVETVVDKSATWVPVTVTFTFAAVPTQAPLPGKGEVGMGTLTGKTGVVRTAFEGAARPMATVGPVVGVGVGVGMGVAGIVGMGWF